MNYGSCSCCGKGIRFDGLSLCKDCEEKYLHSVKEYIYEHGVSTAEEINKVTHVPIQIILYFLNHDYLSKSTSTSEKILKDNIEEQERLRKKALIDALAGSFKDKTVVEKEEFAKPEMHFLGRDRRR